MEEGEMTEDLAGSRSDPIPKGSIWVSRGRRVRVQVVNLARHGEDCASRFVLYTNLEPTEDFAPGERWILGVEAFRARFDPAPPGRGAP
jgi:hypothetical protein